MTYGRNGCVAGTMARCAHRGRPSDSSSASVGRFRVGGRLCEFWGGGGGCGWGAKSAHELCSFATSPNVSIPSVAICALSASHLARSSTSTCCDGIFFFRYGMCVGCREWGVGVILFSLFSMAVRKKLHVHGSNDGCANI